MTPPENAASKRHHFREGDMCGVCRQAWPCCSDGWSHRGSQICERCGISLVLLPPTDDWPVTKVGEGVELLTREDAPKGLFHDDQPDT